MSLRCALLLLAATAARALVAPPARSPGRGPRAAVRDDAELPEVEPGSVDWDDAFKKLKRGETDTSKAKLNELGLDVERAGRVARQNAKSAASSASRAARGAAKSAPRLSKDATFWFGIILAISLFPLLVSQFSGPPADFGQANVYV